MRLRTWRRIWRVSRSSSWILRRRASSSASAEAIFVYRWGGRVAACAVVLDASIPTGNKILRRLRERLQLLSGAARVGVGAAPTGCGGPARGRAGSARARASEVPDTVGQALASAPLSGGAGGTILLISSATCADNVSICLCVSASCVSCLHSPPRRGRVPTDAPHSKSGFALSASSALFGKKNFVSHLLE